ncbi:MAG: hypothetical protein GX796_03805 [Clostridiaceae bacterium]|nr:hypothetical protein [Clostridiaceae bacterium]
MFTTRDMITKKIMTLCFVILFSTAYAQTASNDTIIKIDGTLIVAKIITVSENEITFSYPNETIQNIISKNRIQEVIYSSGRKEIFNETKFETFTDSRDGNVYKIVTIGEQTWMAENLAYLPSVVGPKKGSRKEALYYVHGYDGTDVAAAKANVNYKTFGVLYNWFAAMEGAKGSDDNPSGIKGVCPAGWHLPSVAEWTQLEDYLSITGNRVAKSMATDSGWYSSRYDGAIGNTDYPEYRNKSGFSALPAGLRLRTGTFYVVGEYSYWWCSSDKILATAFCRFLVYDDHRLGSAYHPKEVGFSVRCVKD